jgi:hypothetical protein
VPGCGKEVEVGKKLLAYSHQLEADLSLRHRTKNTKPETLNLTNATPAVVLPSFGKTTVSNDNPNEKDFTHLSLGRFVFVCL